MTHISPHNKPLVSVLIPVRNGGDYLHSSITSALAQTYPEIEIIISNNHSTDFSQDIIAGFDKPRIKKIKPPRSLTMTENWNYTLAHAKGKYAVLLGADDILHADFVAERIAYHESNPEVFLSSSPHNVIDENGAITSVGDSALRGLLNREQLIPLLLQGNPLNILTVFFKIENTESRNTPTFPDQYFSDWALWLEMILAHNYVYFFDHICCDYRIHSASMTSATGTSKWNLEFIKLTSNFFNLHYKQLSSLGFDREDVQKKQTSNLWLGAQRALRDGEWTTAYQLWSYYRRYHSMLDLISGLVNELRHKLPNALRK